MWGGAQACGQRRCPDCNESWPSHRVPRLRGEKTLSSLCMLLPTLQELLEQAPFSPDCPFFAVLVFCPPWVGAAGIMKAGILPVIWDEVQWSSGGFSGPHVLDEDTEVHGGGNSEAATEPSL